MLYEIRFHGRGGQGAVTAANLLVRAALLEGKWGVSFPFFGAERRGAPVTAYARISDGPLKIHQQIYEPDIIVVLDPKIPSLVDVSDGLKDDGIAVVNSPSKPDNVKASKIYFVDATGIALELGLVVAGWPVVNTSMLGALVKATGIVSIDSVVSAIKEWWKGRVGELNAKAALRAYEEVKAVE